MDPFRFFRRRRSDEQAAHELEAHLDLEISLNIARGMSPEQARIAAQAKLGNATAIREEIYHMNSIGFIETLWHDVRYGFRALRNNPGFTVVALLSLALGIGATTAIFSVVYGVLVAPYPYARAAEIWSPEIHDRKNPDQGRSSHLPDYIEMKKLAAFSETMATFPESRLLTGDHAPENFQSINVTANAFHFLGVPPVLGRTILPSDVKPDGQPESVIVLSYKAWLRLFDGDGAALGKTVLLNEQPFTVIGVMPPRFGWWTADGGWIILPENPRDNHWVSAIVRLKPEVSPEVAQQQLQAFYSELAARTPADYPKGGIAMRLKNYLDVTVASGEMQSSLRMLFGAVAFLLLIACANVANLQLARGTARAHEIAVRMSIGASRGRVFRQLLTESVALSLAGGVLGILFALAITKGVVALMPEFYVPNEARITVNSYVLLFSAGVSALTGIVFGLAPALKCSKPDLVDTLKDAGRSLSTSAGGRTRQALVMVEIALSVVLLMGASLTIRGFQKLQSQDTGLHTDKILMVGLPLSPKRYATYERRVAFSESVLASVSQLPGVQSAAIGNGSLPFGGPQSGYTISGQPHETARPLLIGLISANYPQTLGIALRAGRLFNAQEVARAEPVALVNETAAKLWPAGTSPIGARVHLDFLERPNPGVAIPPQATPDVIVIGILADTRNDGLRSPVMPAAFIPYTRVAPTSRTLALRTASNPLLLLNAVRQSLRVIDKDLPLNRPTTLEDVIGQETVQPRFNMALFTFFGLLGLALAAVGIYSMLSYSVARRTHELGIRMALGADSREVLRLVLIMGGKLAIAGLILGLAGSIALAKVLRSQIFQVPETDLLTLAGVILPLAAAAFLACLLPALRAARLDPMIAVRHD